MRFAVMIALCLGACAASPNGGGSTSGGGGDDDGTGSGSDMGSGSDTGTPITLDAYLSQMGMMDCDEAFKCMASFPTDAGGTFQEFFGATPQDCYASSAMYYDVAKIQAEITAGKITFDGAAAGACIAGMSYGTCAQYWADGGDYPVACDTAMVGTVADGAACVIDFDCSNIDSICDATTMKCGPDTGT